MNQSQPSQNQARLPLHYPNIFFLISMPIVALIGITWYSFNVGVSWVDLAIFTFMYFATGIAITAGYHRYYSHRSYSCGKTLQIFYLLFGAAAAENSLLSWASDHRDHHRYVDQDNDPYNINKGFFYAHMGWIFYKSTDRTANAPDLLKDPLVLWQDRWYPFLVVAVGFTLPTFLGLLGGHPLGGLLWGGFLRLVVVHHATFLINSAAHFWGQKPYSLNNSARDNGLLAPLTFGEGYHNFHHKFPSDWRNGIRWHHFDIGKWWLLATSSMGLASKLNRTPEPLILKAKLDVEMEIAKRKLLNVETHSGIWEKVNSGLEIGRKHLESSMERYYQTALNYRQMKRTQNAELIAKLRKDIRRYRAELSQTRRAWAQAMKMLNGLSYSGARNVMLLTAVADIFKSHI